MTAEGERLSARPLGYGLRSPCPVSVRSSVSPQRSATRLRKSCGCAPQLVRAAHRTLTLSWAFHFLKVTSDEHKPLTPLQFTPQSLPFQPVISATRKRPETGPSRAGTATGQCVRGRASGAVCVGQSGRRARPGQVRPDSEGLSQAEAFLLTTAPPPASGDLGTHPLPARQLVRMRGDWHCDGTTASAVTTHSRQSREGACLAPATGLRTGVSQDQH